MSKWGRKTKEPEGFDYVKPVLDTLENELREKLAEPSDGKNKNEVLWPIHQINWQKSRYIYDMRHRYNRISPEVYDYCIKHKLVDGALISKWKKPEYRRLCSTYVINRKNYPFGTTSLCRVPRSSMAEDSNVLDATTGCRGCASGRDGYGNIFGNKYGQRLAKIQIKREELCREEGSTCGDNNIWANTVDNTKYAFDQDSDSDTDVEVDKKEHEDSDSDSETDVENDAKKRSSNEDTSMPSSSSSKKQKTDN